MTPYGPLETYMEYNNHELGRHSATYIFNSIKDLHLIKETASNLSLDLPECIVTNFSQETYSMWQDVAPCINIDAPPVVCNVLLDCLDDNERHTEVKFKFSFKHYLSSDL